MQNIKVNQLIKYCMVFVMIITIFIFIIPKNVEGSFNIMIMFTFVLNGTIWFVLFIREVKKYPYSFMMMHWFFCIMFFFLAPIVQYAYKEFPWIYSRTEELLLRTNIYLFLWTLGLYLGSKFIKKNKWSITKSIFNKEYVNGKNVMIILTCISGLIMIWRLSKVGFGNLLARATADMEYSSNSSLSLLIGQCCQAICYFAVIISLLEWKRNKRSFSWVIINAIFLCISYFPTALARYAMAAIYGGCVLTFMKKKRRSRLFIMAFIIAFMILLPLLNAFRRTEFMEVSLVENLVNVVTNLDTGFLEGDYDAYTMFTITIEDVDRNGITWGMQMLGAILFFVPRSIWKDKPVGSGHFVAGNLDWEFTNLSCPLPAEAYINFGVIGIIIFSFVIGNLLGKVDLWYWEKNNTKNGICKLGELFYPILMFMFFFMSRGDLMSSFAYSCAFFAVGFIILHGIKSK